MPVSGGRSVWARWLSGRALALHLTAVLAVPTCLLATWWQVHRALSGNLLSWAYTFEWPAFAGVAVWAWWVLLHLPDRQAPSPAAAQAADRGQARPLRPKQAARQRLLERRRASLRWDPSIEGPRLQAYNAYLAQLQGATPSEARRIPRPAGGGRD